MPFNSTQTVVGLNTTTINIPTTDQYNFIGTLTTKNNDGSMSAYGPGGGAGTGVGAATPIQSQVIVTVKQNGSTILTTHAGDRGFALNTLQCTAGDVITFALSSSSTQDQSLQSTKMTLAVSEGPM
jgi:hypothetical protein